MQQTQGVTEIAVILALRRVGRRRGDVARRGAVDDCDEIAVRIIATGVTPVDSAADHDERHRHGQPADEGVLHEGSELHEGHCSVLATVRQPCVMR